MRKYYLSLSVLTLFVLITLYFTWKTFMITFERALICCLKNASGALKSNTVVLDEINQNILSHYI